MKDLLTLGSKGTHGRPLTTAIGESCYSTIAYLLKVRDKAYELPGQAFDRWHGVDTTGVVQVSDLVIPERMRPEAARYQPTKISVFNHLVDRLPIDDRQQFAFVDFGCGKGRCLLLAARSGFGSVIGIELSEPLCRVAARNAERFAGGRYDSRIEIQCTDSSAAVLPRLPSVYFFYNPFGEQSMLNTMQCISAHLAGTTHEAYAVYVNPMHSSSVAAGGFELVETGRRRSEDWAIWYRPPASAVRRTAKAA